MTLFEMEKAQERNVGHQHQDGQDAAQDKGEG
jgi:hypothetical protein